MSLAPGAKLGPYEILAEWTMTADGQRFLFVDYPRATSQTIRVLLNWQARLK